MYNLHYNSNLRGTIVYYLNNIYILQEKEKYVVEWKCLSSVRWLGVGPEVLQAYPQNTLMNSFFI